MKKLFLTILILVGAFATMSAQDEIEQTDAPVIYYDYDEYSRIATITIDPVDPATDMIYWRYMFEDGEWTEWMIYEGPICFDMMGRYQLEAYASCPGKTDSDVVCLWFEIYEPTDMYHVQIADIGADGFYYKFTSDSTVIVSLNDTYDYPYTEPFGWELYSECPYSGDIVIPATVEYEGNTYTVEGIDSYAFINSKLTSISLPNTLKSISSRAFIHATIESGSIFIPASVTTIEAGAFADCYNLESVQVDENNPVYDSRDNCNAIIETATNTIVAAFNSTIIPSSVTAIGNDAFAGDAYSGWGYYTGCTFSDYVIPNSIQTIGDFAFYLCTSLNNITFNNELTSIGNYAFGVCSNLKSVIIPDNVINIGNGAFCHCYSLTSATIGNSVTSIGDNAFYMCGSLTNLSLGNSVTSIGEEAFWRCDQLTSINFPNSLTSIGALAFNECSKLSNITFGDNLSSIGNAAFADCVSLTSVTIPGSVTSIGNYAFHRCDGLQRITCMSTTPQDIDQNCFKCYTVNIYDQATLFVPNESLEAYQAHAEWGKFVNIVPFIGAGPGDVNGDGNIAISDVTGLIDMLLSGDELPAWADVNGDGNVTIADVTVLIDMLLNGN